MDKTNCHGWDMEYSVHQPPKSLKSELCLVAPDVVASLETEGGKSGPGRRLLVVLVFQRSQTDLCDLCEAAAKEKDRLLERFLQWAHAVREGVYTADPGALVEALDPSSGQPYWGSVGSSVHNDVEGAQQLLRYHALQQGGCTLLCHPSWGTSSYPSTLLAVTEVASLLDAIAATIAL